jgi:hypothetical protein
MAARARAGGSAPARTRGRAGWPRSPSGRSRSSSSRSRSASSSRETRPSSSAPGERPSRCCCSWRPGTRTALPSGAASRGRSRPHRRGWRRAVSAVATDRHWLAAPRRLPRLLSGLAGNGVAVDLDSHLRLHGPAPRGRPELVTLVEQSGLRGRGGGSSPLFTLIGYEGVAPSRPRDPAVGDPTRRRAPWRRARLPGPESPARCCQTESRRTQPGGRAPPRRARLRAPSRARG